MSLAGRSLVIALLVAFAVGVAVGSFAAGWAKARGVPVVSAIDAGVRVEVDAGTSSKSDCGAVVEHWTTVYVPGPTRYIPTPDGGQRLEQPQVVAVLVPDVRLTASGASSGVVEAEGQAEATARVSVVPVAPERHWEVGPVALYGVSAHEVLVGGEVGWSGGPFGVRLEVLKGPTDVYAGGALVWRW